MSTNLTKQAKVSRSSTGRPASVPAAIPLPSKDSLIHSSVQKLPAHQLTMTGLDTVGPAEYVAIIREGVPARKVMIVSRQLNYPKSQLLTILDLPASTVDRKIKQREKLSQEQSERFLGLERLISQAKTMVTESGDPEGFNTAQWLGEWLDQPLPALGGKKPNEFMDTVAGQGIVARLLAQMQSGAYA